MNKWIICDRVNNIPIVVRVHTRNGLEDMIWYENFYAAHSAFFMINEEQRYKYIIKKINIS